ncbi:nucleic acid-binding protein [Annulohypoxylon maeteangense]|uniref:nucleic acid-binding protein n=1 Tax=Annulohypoxylon maeteangense TaxID=1927788 RepID=UPI0020089C5E|nr:nucleic acid-binding protein [Annulohypoxylon maeteangense]KAI0883423.1 nucleic acid-binding protein [Annulohypoxylon maeteangense]
MGSLKRKDAPGASSTSKAPKAQGDSRPSKRPKPEKTSAKDDAKSSSNSKPAKPSAVSRLKEEEPLFPRGGGSVLTPLEHKQISIQAKQDVLFEQESGQGTVKPDRASKKKKVKVSKDGKSGKHQSDESAKIESLNYKRLVKGSLVLGQVSAIHPLEVVLTLPSNLSGHVPITAISDVLNERIAAETADVEAEDDEEDADDNDIDLKTIFRVGQYLRAYVTSTIEESTALSAKPRKHIELSLRPTLANTGLSSQDVIANCTVMATVVSAEDHGFVMDFGLPDSGIRGFLPRKELAEDISDSQMQPGGVILCMVTGKSAKGKVAQLTTLPKKIGKVQNFASEATTINAFLPGSAVEFMVSEIANRGILGKVMGSLDVTADLIHSGLGPNALDLESKYKVGKKYKARVICNFPTAKDPKLGISLLDHVVSLQSKLASTDKLPTDVLPTSAIVEECTVTKVEPEIGLFLDVGVEGVPGFVHVSRIKDGKVDMLSESSGPFKTGSVHRGRVISYNAIDGIFNLSFEKHILEQPFLRIEDIPVGEIVNGEIEKILINQDGVSGVLVKLAEGIVGYVSEMHLADVRLQHPEKKFREGLKVKARVLSVNPAKRRVRLTLKKTLVNSEAIPLKSFDEVTVGMQVPGIITKVIKNGAIIQFYGTLRGFLPISEMSEAYIQDPSDHFRAGQVVSVHVLNFDAEARKLFVSCKDPSAFGLDKQNALRKLRLGDVVSAKVVQKTEDDVLVELVDSSLKAMISKWHLADRPNKCQAALKRVHVGQTLKDLVVLEKNEGRRFIALSKKPSFVKAGQEGKLLTSLKEAKVDELRQGFVINITPTAAFIQFCGRLIALLPKSKFPQEDQTKTDFGLQKYESIAVKIHSIDTDHNRFVVASSSFEESDAKNGATSTPADKLENPIDQTISSMDDIVVGKVTEAKIVSIRSTQLNVKLSDNVQGRVDVSQVFDTWDKILHQKSPLDVFHANDTIKVRVLGVHDARNHRFLPISHRSTRSILELSAKPRDLKGNTPQVLSYDKLEPGSSHIGFVNNNAEKNALWVTLSPGVRGRISNLEISDDVSQLENLATSFPIGSALRVRVLAVNAAESRLDLSARSASSSPNLTWKSIKQNMVLPSRVTKVNERQVIVQLNDVISGPVHLIDLGDDYSQANTLSYNKNDVIRVSVVEVDKSNKKLRLSARPSRVLNSSLPIKDREITQASQIKTGDIIRGFVKNVSDKGLFVGLGGNVTAMVRISDLSDKFLKDWKDEYQVDQLVKGRIISVDSTTGHIQMSLKASVVDKDFVPTINYSDLSEGQIVTGTVRKVEDFGAFIVIENSANVSGLCHRSEMAEKSVEDARKLFSEGDVVKAIILKLDKQKKRINFGLKPSYFEGDMDVDDSDEDDDAGVTLLSDDDDDEADDDDEMEDAGVSIILKGAENDSDESSDDEDTEMIDRDTDEVAPLEVGGFDWSAGALDKTDAADEDTDNDASASQKKKKKKRSKPQIEVDKSGDLDAFGPRTAVDYEQLLNRQPNSSALWIEYMAHQMQVSEPAKAREVAERAVSTISSTEETEKLNAWIAYLNLEVRFGNDDSVEEVFKRACQVNDQQEVHQRLASIYIQEDKTSKADDLFQTLVKKFGASSPEVWYNYAHWLHSIRNQPERARALLPRATQALPNHARFALMTKFAALEFVSTHPNPELGRTMFEGLLSTFPKRIDLWNQLLDHEDAVPVDNSKASITNKKAAVRDVFDRATKVKGLKARAAKKWFKRWADWEEKNGDAKSRAKVSAKAAEWVKAKAEAKERKEREKEDEEGSDSDDE